MQSILRKLSDNKHALYSLGGLIALPFTLGCSLERFGESREPVYLSAYKIAGSVIFWPISVPYYAYHEVMPKTIQQ